MTALMITSLWRIVINLTSNPSFLKCPFLMLISKTKVDMVRPVNPMVTGLSF
jgi:hypothetical protein